MKKHILVELAVCGLALQMTGAGRAMADEAAFKTDPEKIGYAFGMSIGTSLKKDNIPADPDSLGKAATAQLTGAPSLMTPEEIASVIKSLPAGPTNLPAGQKNFKNVKEEVGYAIGSSFGHQMDAMEMDLDVASVVKGLKDSLAGGPTLLNTNELKTVFAGLQTKMQDKQDAEQKEREALFKEESAKHNLKEGAAFLAKNKTPPGVKSLASGLQYTVITAGTGPIPKPTDSVMVNYRGTFLDGKEFDASRPH